MDGNRSALRGSDPTTGASGLLLASVDGGDPSLSADGSLMAFSAQNPSGFNLRNVVRDRSTGQQQVLETTSAGVLGNSTATAMPPWMSRDCSSVAFNSRSTNLVAPWRSPASVVEGVR